MRVELEHLGGNKLVKFTDEMMRACDLFPESKRFVTYDRMVVYGTPNLDKLCEIVAESFKAAGGFAIFVAIRKVDGKRGNWPVWFERGISTVAMDQGEGLSWGLFKDILQQLDYNVQTDVAQKVIEIS